MESFHKQEQYYQQQEGMIIGRNATRRGMQGNGSSRKSKLIRVSMMINGQRPRQTADIENRERREMRKESKDPAWGRPSEQSRETNKIALGSA